MRVRERVRARGQGRECSGGRGSRRRARAGAGRTRRAQLKLIKAAISESTINCEQVRRGAARGHMDDAKEP